MVPVSVNPQSSTQAASYAGGGIGDTTFAIGGNPNLAVLLAGGAKSWINPVLIGAGIALIFFLFIRRK